MAARGPGLGPPRWQEDWGQDTRRSSRPKGVWTDWVKVREWIGEE